MIDANFRDADFQDLDFDQVLDDPNSWHSFFEALPEDRKAEIAKIANEVKGLAPMEGPQTEAFMSDAKVVGYGGSGGGGKSALIILLAILKHRHSIVFRYDKSQLGGLINDAVRFHGSGSGLNRGDGVFRFSADHYLEYAGIGKPDEEENWQGQPHDFIAIDEATQLPLAKILFVLGWLRTVVPGLKPKLLMTFNPPRRPVGRWVITYYAPWLDKAHPAYPAQPGRKFYYYRDVEGEEIELDDEPAEPIELDFRPKGGEITLVTPDSRTFFPARVWHNKYLVAAGYQSHLANLPPEERDMLLLGDFQASIKDDDYQLVPTAWIEEAMQRWEPNGKSGHIMDAIGIDPVQGGKDKCIHFRRHGVWWDKPVEQEGVTITSGSQIARKALDLRGNTGARLCVDCVGVGTATYMSLDETYHSDPVGIKGSWRKNLPKRIEAKKQFYNMRSVLGWTLRRILDPDNGLSPSLPPSPRMRDEIVAHHYTEVGGVTQVEPKDSVKETLKHSPDYFDALIYSVYPIAMRLEEIAEDVYPKQPERRIVEPVKVQTSILNPYQFLRQRHW